MIRKIQLSIPEPCHENWYTMTPVEKGRFCAACQKEVYDFTKSSDREILKAYNTNEKLCGRFLSTQLERELILPRERKSIWLTSIFFGIISFVNNKTIAQEKPIMVQTEKKADLQGKIAIPEDSIKERTITGIVSDTSGLLPGANVINKTKNKGVSTDFNGNFSIEAEEGDQLVFSFIGMEEKIITFKKSEDLNIILNDSVKGLVGEVVVEGVHKKRTFLGRTFRKIGNLFR
jgi:CarboxypepD_reg-like domain